MGGEEGSGVFSVLGVRVCTGTVHVGDKEGEGRRRKEEEEGGAAWTRRREARFELLCTQLKDGGERVTEGLLCGMFARSSANRPSVKDSEHKDEEQGKHFESHPTGWL
ncbi:hypothetical protein EYF80_066886 [Liparis tanakae]|uniref:Uncharacterized protein n=1 Tax=Liparis tanakae TaxID=230148 RepID=A0A4Z2E2M9_9TELE|nr:hypothetical protein EYF80_066886 [Liparis tanakae]